MKLKATLAVLLCTLVLATAIPYGAVKGSSQKQYDQLRSQDETLTEADSGFEDEDGRLASTGSKILVGPYNYELIESDTGGEDKGRLTSAVKKPFSQIEEFESSGSLPEIQTEEAPQYVPDINPGGGLKNSKDEGGPGEERPSWITRLAKKWDLFGDKTKAIAKSIGEGIHSFYEHVQFAIPQLWEKFKSALKGYGAMVHRGAEYAVQRISAKFDELAASQVITKLQQRLDEGDQSVTSFFEKIGKKATDWMKKHDNVDIDSGLYQEGQEFGQHFADPTFPDLFQDEEIQEEVKKMVGTGVITQIEADRLYQQKSKDIPKDVLDDKHPEAAVVEEETYSSGAGKEEPLETDIEVGSGHESDSAQQHEGKDLNKQGVDPHNTVKKELINPEITGGDQQTRQDQYSGQGNQNLNDEPSGDLKDQLKQDSYGQEFQSSYDNIWEDKKENNPINFPDKW